MTATMPATAVTAAASESQRSNRGGKDERRHHRRYVPHQNVTHHNSLTRYADIDADCRTFF